MASSSHSSFRVLRWLARGLSALLIVVFLFFFLGETVFGNSEQKEPLSSNAIAQLSAMGVVLIGFVLAWTRESIGGTCALVGFVGISILNTRVLSSPIMYLFPLTAILFLICSKWGRPAQTGDTDVPQAG